MVLCAIFGVGIQTPEAGGWRRARREIDCASCYGSLPNLVAAGGRNETVHCCDWPADFSDGRNKRLRGAQGRRPEATGRVAAIFPAAREIPRRSRQVPLAALVQRRQAGEDG